jgi:hypothetical protein
MPTTTFIARLVECLANQRFRCTTLGYFKKVSAVRLHRAGAYTGRAECVYLYKLCLPSRLTLTNKAEQPG